MKTEQSTPPTNSPSASQASADTIEKLRKLVTAWSTNARSRDKSAALAHDDPVDRGLLKTSSFAYKDCIMGVLREFPEVAALFQVGNPPSK